MLDYDKHQAHIITIFSVIPLLLSFLGLVNWLLRALISFSGISILSLQAPSTMLCIFVISVLLMFRVYFKSVKWSLVDYLVLGLVLIYSFMVLFSFFWDAGHRPHELVWDISIAPQFTLLAPMAPLSALFLIFICCSYIIHHAPFFQSLTKRRFSGYFALLSFSGSALVILSQLSRVMLLPAMGVVPVSIITAICLFCLSLALLESVDLGLLRVFLYVSGNQRDKAKGINQLNAMIFFFIVIVSLGTAIVLLNGEKRTAVQNLQQQILLNLDAQKNTLNLWINNHYNTLNTATEDPILMQGMRDQYLGNSHSEAAEYAYYWAEIIKQQHHAFRIAIYNANDGSQKAFGEALSISPGELRQIHKSLKKDPTIYVQSKLSLLPNAMGEREVEYLRYWTLMPSRDERLLLLMELQPERYIRSVLTQVLGTFDISHNHIFGYDGTVLHQVADLSCTTEENACDFIRTRLNERVNTQGMDLPDRYVAQTYNRKGSEVYYAAVKLEHLPWIMVQSVDSIFFTWVLAKWAWVIAGICTILFFALAYFMNHSSRRKAILDDQIALMEWQNTFNAVPSATWLMDTQGCIKRVNKAIEMLLGIKEGDALGKSYHQIIPELLADPNTEALHPGQELHGEFQHKGRWFESSIAPIMNDSGTLQNYVQIVSDITEKKEFMHRLQASEMRFRAIFDQSPIGISVISSDLLYLSSNTSFMRFLGYSDRELMGMYLPESTHPDYAQAITKGIGDLLAGHKKVYRQELRFIRKDQSEFWGLLNCILITNTDSEGDFILAMVENTQERVETMQELYHAKEMAIMSEQLKSNFMQNISHEFRTPLNGILGFSQILKNGMAEIDEVRDYADSIYQSGKRMHQLIENIMSFAKVDSGQENLIESPFSLKVMLNKIYDLYKSRALNKNLQLNCDIPLEYEESILIGDESKIIQILAKLMDNAIAFTEHGKIECLGHLELNTLILQVKDTGIGISPDDQETIFNSFYQADMSFTRTHAGAGLGLSICKGLANILKGDISVVSQLNAGTTFTVKIPIKGQK